MYADSRISVIVPFYNSRKTIRKTLEGLAASSVPLREVLCIDDGSDDGTAQLIHEFASSDGRLSNLEVIASGEGRRGPAVARNLGARRAGGEYLVYIDSDVVPEPKTIEILSAAVAEGGCVAAVAHFQGTSLQPGILAHFQAHTVYEVFAALDPLDSPCLGTQCVLIRRDVFLQANGFDENYARATVEDFAFGYRLRRHGWSIRCLPEARIFHNHDYTLSSFARNYYAKARDLTHVLLTDPSVSLGDTGYFSRSNSIVLMLFGSVPFLLFCLLAVRPGDWWAAFLPALFGLLLWIPYVIAVSRGKGVSVAIRFLFLRAFVVLVAGIGSAVSFVKVCARPRSLATFQRKQHEAV